MAAREEVAACKRRGRGKGLCGQKPVRCPKTNGVVVDEG
jgi:hypothetical protein